MKILKKFLLIGLFSFVFVVNAYANTQEWTNLIDVSSKNSFIENNKILLNNIEQYIKNNFEKFESYNSKINLSNDETIIFYKQDDLGTNSIRVYFIDNSRNFIIRTSGSSNIAYDIYFIVFIFNFDENYNILSVEPRNNAQLMTGSYSVLNNLIFDWRFGKNSNLLINNSTDYNIILNNNYDMLSTKTTMNAYNYIVLLNYDLVNVEPTYNEKGTYEDSEVITYKIKDEEVGNDKELKLKFTFLNQLDITKEDIEIYKYGSQVYTQYNMICNNIDTNSVCEFVLKYNVYDSIEDKLMFDFKFYNRYKVKVEDSSGNNGVYSNYKDVEYEIKVINLKEKSGGVFYLRNYDNYEYLSSFYEKDYFGFSFYSSHPSNLKFYKVIYPNDIQYKNNYIYKGNDNFYHYNSGSYNNINNFEYYFIPFSFDLNLLLENKFSSFTIRNRNYLGENDLENQDLYISYNSSLFNINYLNSSNIIDNGNVDSFIGTDVDFNFTFNGSQNSYDVGVITGEKFEFDKDIKVSYNNGFEYFKDKIIDMFELVSDFFNTMPQKFKIAFSFIFVLLIGIALFRLLL